MGKFDSIKMQDLVEVKDPDENGGVTLVFNENKSIQLKVAVSYTHLTLPTICSV